MVVGWGVWLLGGGWWVGWFVWCCMGAKRGMSGL